MKQSIAKKTAESLKITIGKGRSFPDEIFCLRELKSLTINAAGNKTPFNLKNLSLFTNLQELTLRNIYIEGNVFETIASLAKLELLEITGDEFQIDELPDIFSNMQHLRKFRLKNNFVRNLPPSLFNLPKLTELTITQAGITAIDENIIYLQNLECLDLSGNMLETLHDSIFNLPLLKKLDISDNFFNKKEIAAIRKKIKTSSSRKIKLSTSGQDDWKEVKEFQALQHIAARKDTVPLQDGKGLYYIKFLAAAIIYRDALKLVDKRINGHPYYKLCQVAVHKYGTAISHVDPERLQNNSAYYHLCLRAVKGSVLMQMNQGIDMSDNFPEGIGNRFEDIQDQYLTYEEYLKICVIFVTHNSDARALQYINRERLSREDYERICWIAILHHFTTVGEMADPGHSHCLLAVKLGAHLRLIPAHMRSYEVCACAIQNENGLLSVNDIPEQHKDEEMLSLIALAKAGIKVSYHEA